MNIAEKEISSLPHMSAIIEEDEPHGHNATSAFIADLIGNVTDIDLRTQLRRLEVSDSVDCQQLFGGRVLSEYSHSSSKQQLFDPSDESGLELNPFSERVPQSKYFEKFLQGEDLTDTSTSSMFLGKPAEESYSRGQENRKLKSNQKNHSESSRQETRDNEQLMDGYMKLKKQIEELAQQVQGGQDKRNQGKEKEEHDNSNSFSKNKLQGGDTKDTKGRRKRTNSSIEREIISKQLLEELQLRHNTEIQQLRGQMLKLVEEKSTLEMRFQESQKKIITLTDDLQKQQDSLQKKADEIKQDSLRMLRESEEKIKERERLNDEKTKYLDERTKQLEEKLNQVKEREMRVQQREDRVFDKEDRIQEREDRVINKENRMMQAEKDAVVKQDEQSKLEKIQITNQEANLKQQQNTLQQQLNYSQQNQQFQNLQQTNPQIQLSLAPESNQENINSVHNSFQSRMKQSHQATPNLRTTELDNYRTQEQQQQQQIYLQQQKQFLSPPVRLRGSFHSEKPQTSDLSPLQKELSVNSEAAPRNLNPSDRQLSEQSHRESIASESSSGYQQLQQRQYQTDSIFYPLGMNSKKSSSKCAQKLNIDKIHSEIQMLKQSLLSTDLLLRQSKSINHQERQLPLAGGKSSNRSSTPQTSLINAKDNSSFNSSNPSNNKNLITTGEDRFLSETSKDSDSQVLNNNKNIVLGDKFQNPRINVETLKGMQSTRRITSCRTEVDQSAFFSVNQSEYAKPIFSLDKSRHQSRQNQVTYPQRDIQKVTNASSPSLVHHPILATDTHLLVRATQREKHPDRQSKLREDQMRREVSARPRLSEHSASEIQILQSRSNSINQSSNSSNNIIGRNPNQNRQNISQLGLSKAGYYTTTSQHNNYFPLQQQNNNKQTNLLSQQHNLSDNQTKNQKGYLENIPSIPVPDSNSNNLNRDNQKLHEQQNKQILEPKSIPISQENSQNNISILHSQGATNAPSNHQFINNSSNNNMQVQFFSNNSSSNQQFYRQGNMNNLDLTPSHIAEIEESKWKQYKSGSSSVSPFQSNNNSNQIYSQIPAAHAKSTNLNSYQAYTAHFHPSLVSSGISKQDLYNSNNNSNNSQLNHKQISSPSLNPQVIQKQQEIHLQKQQFLGQKRAQEQTEMYSTLNSLKAQFNPASQNYFVNGITLINGDHAISYQGKDQEQQQYLSNQQDPQLKIPISSSSNQYVPFSKSNQFLQNNHQNFGSFPTSPSQKYAQNKINSNNRQYQQESEGQEATQSTIVSQKAKTQQQQRMGLDLQKNCQDGSNGS